MNSKFDFSVCLKKVSFLKLECVPGIPGDAFADVEFPGYPGIDFIGEFAPK